MILIYFETADISDLNTKLQEGKLYHVTCFLMWSYSSSHTCQRTES